LNSLLAQKSKDLLGFLMASANMRRKRGHDYGPSSRILWLKDIPRDLPQLRSAFFSDKPGENPDLWLEVRKTRMPARPVEPPICSEWVRAQELEQPFKEPELLTKITVLVEKKVPVNEEADGGARMRVEKVAEERRLEDHPEVQDAWLEYLINKWEPWAKEKRRWQENQRIYEEVDFMRWRLEEAEESFELVLCLGFAVWRDPTGVTVRRHFLTGAAEINLDAARGILTVGPAATFDLFRIELDMLETQHRPLLIDTDLDDQIQSLDVQGWDRAKVGEILRVIANKTRPDAQVEEDSFTVPERADGTLRVFYAPALVLRERRPTAYEELITRLRDNTETNSRRLHLTLPWAHFLMEGQAGGDKDDTTTADPEGYSAAADTRLYFPLQTNEEQRKIAQRLQSRPFVLVKGPPGTGKSHTIANLICHLLASGERVLVTAQASKALVVLKEKLPAEIRNLCVTSLGSTREDQKLLEDSVRGILSRKNYWMGNERAQERIKTLERELRHLEDRSAQLTRQLREYHESQNHEHSLYGGYQGTAARIARAVEEKAQKFSWFPALTDEDSRCPIGAEEIGLLAEIHRRLTSEKIEELRLSIGGGSLPDPEEFELALSKLKDAEQAAETAFRGIDRDRLQELASMRDNELIAAADFLTALEDHAARASRVLGERVSDIFMDHLVGHRERWLRLAEEAENLVDALRQAKETLGNARVDVSAGDIDEKRALADARRRLAHFESGGWRGLGILAPHVVRETRHVEMSFLIDGRTCRQSPQLKTLIAFLELRQGMSDFLRVWPFEVPTVNPDPGMMVALVEERVEELKKLLAFFQSESSDVLSLFTASRRVDFADVDERLKWLALIRAEAARRRLERARKPLESWVTTLRQLVASGNAHPCLQQMVSAVEGRDAEMWKRAWETRELFKEEKKRVRSYESLIRRLGEACPGLGALLKETQGRAEWESRLLDLQEAWAWAAAKAWLRRVADPSANQRLEGENQRLQDRIEKKIAELSALKAWRAFFGRLDDRTEQLLTAWNKAVSRVGKGTGKYAYRHRKAARVYLTQCIPKIPAWVMPLHKLWETTETETGVFDTVIIDEASQAGIDALVLLLLAKRIVVVGDDKQNSPEAVGVQEEDIARLAREHLRLFHFHREFRPDTSLYDHAERAFGNTISLREHFRCVPEIIRFSNELCYTDAPLIPLRQPPPQRIPPLKATFVKGGACEGEGQRVINRAEADEVVAAIVACIKDKAYEDKTMGVIVLQGHAQAELIEKKLAEVLEPRVRQERKLRCGRPSTFQGDERDVIFLSLVMAPNRHFRALTGLDDQRRFNVAMSRARDQVWLFHSLRQHDLSREDLRWRLLQYFYGPKPFEEHYEELERLEREARRRNRQHGQQPDPYESWFEVDVALELLRRMYRVRPQMEVAGYRIDLVVEGLQSRLAVECDGDVWHGPERYDHDTARQRQLERVGWTFVRIGEAEFYTDREAAVGRILEACESLGIRPVGQEEPDGNDEETAAEEAEVNALVDEVEIQDTEEKDSAYVTPQEDLWKPGFPDPRDASPANVRAALHQIIEKEGPITKRLTFRRYADGCLTLNRMTSNVKAILNRILSAMLRAKEIEMEDELGDRSLEGQVLRISGTPRVRERAAEGRDLLEIPPSELLLVIDRLRSSSKENARDDEGIARALLAHYGFVRLTEVKKKHIVKILGVYRRTKL